MTRVNVRKIRIELGLSQPQFAERFGIELNTLRDWEHGRRYPSGPARTLLILISRMPYTVLHHLKAA